MLILFLFNFESLVTDILIDLFSRL